MNELSWLIYFADVLPNVATAITVLSVIASVGSAIVLAVYLTHIGETEKDWVYTTDPVTNKETKEVVRIPTSSALSVKSLAFTRFTTPLFVLIFCLSFVVPSKETFYMIAASQGGERAMQTPEFAKVRSVINKWLDKENAPVSQGNSQ